MKTKDILDETGKKGGMASQRGVEPPTCRLGGGCSIQLSYWDVVAAHSTS